MSFARKLSLPLTALILSAGIASADGHVASTATAELINADGNSIGTATLQQGPIGVLIHLRVEGLTPGKHGLHLHSTASCDPTTGFKSAHGHVGLVEGGHGLMNPEGPEPGDLPNIFVGEDGVGEMEAFSTLVTLGKGENNLLDEDGSTFIIHELPDDHLTQPIGGAGARVACGVISAS